MVFAQQPRLEQVGVELDGHFIYVLRLAVMVQPSVFEVGAGDEHQLQIVNLRNVVAHYPLHSRRVLDVIQLELGVGVNGEGKRRSVYALEYHKTVVRR